MEMKCITLEDGLEYMVLDEIDCDYNTYVYLTNVSDEEDFCIRKVNNKINSELLIGLDSDNEFDKALLLFNQKHHDKL